MFQEIPINYRYGYARVSSQSQKENSSLKGQKQEFIRQGIQKKIFAWRLDLLLIRFENDLFFKS